MEENLPIPGWNAHRHASSPIAQPKYRFEDVPKCQKSLGGSVIQEVTTREAFKEIMGEMVLLCNEAMKRSRAGRTASKPLSLEYIADRLDVDDPCFGYVIRSDEGYLQGFITVTTFTNWQKNFKWDSLNEVSFYYDDDGGHGHHGAGHTIGDGGQGHSSPGRKRNDSPQTPQKNPRKRVVDEDGSLAKELQRTVRLGDPYNEGIVWPRIAEISLLGALGCGKALVELVIEQLEFQRASGTANYDFVALQATDNSIPFYESRGFIRVGAVTYEIKDDSPTAAATRSISPAFSTDSTANETVSSSSSAAAEAVDLEPNSPKKSEAIAMPQTIVSSPHFVHEVVRPGQTPNEIAREFNVSVWDIIFLNKDIYKDLRPTSRLIKGTILHVPESLEEDDGAKKESGPRAPDSPTKWFMAKENDTPRQIAKRFGLACNALVAANRRLLPELQATSRLKAGTRLKVSNLDQQDEICQPYCHWSFPEDTAVEGGEPSYMMVYKLDRKTARNPRTIRNSFAVPVSHHSPPRLLFPPPPKTTSKTATAVPEEQPSRPMVARARKPAPAITLKLPKQPPRPAELEKAPPESGKDIYWEHQREMHPDLAKPTPENEKTIKERWSRLGGYKKERYHAVAAEARKIYDQHEKEYLNEVAQWRRMCKRIQEEHQQAEEQKHAEAAAKQMADKKSTLYNKVVKLRDDALEGKEYQYWFVLTYIPDLKWCHLAPMYQDGHFGADRKKAYGRPRYRLVDEKLGKELDISSSYCIPVRSRALKRTVDADKEEWDIQDGPVKLVKYESDSDAMDTMSSSSRSLSTTKKKLTKQPKFRARSAIKPITGKVAVGNSLCRSQDPLKRTRSSPLPSSRKRSHQEVSTEEVETPMKERNRRRCMRCVEFDAPYDQAVSCLGAKGRFGRDGCEYYEGNGTPRGKFAKLSTPNSGRKPRRCSRCVECGAPDEQASQCPGAKGRFGRSACIFFTSSGEKIVSRDTDSEDSVATEPPRKRQRKESVETKVVVRKDEQVEVVLTPSRKSSSIRSSGRLRQ